MRVIGIDPGSLSCGYGIVERSGNALRVVESGAIRPKRSLPVSERLSEINAQVSLKIKAFSPTCMSIEKVFMAKNSKSAIHLGQARGAALAAAGAGAIDVHEYSSTGVKKSVTGNGRATKDEVKKMVSIMTGKREFVAPDESDAIAVAICHINNADAAEKIPGFSAGRRHKRRFSPDDFPAERKGC